VNFSLVETSNNYFLKPIFETVVEISKLLYSWFKGQVAPVYATVIKHWLALSNANFQYSLIFWLLIHLNILKIRYKVLTFPFSRLQQFLEPWHHVQELFCLEVKCSL